MVTKRISSTIAVAISIRSNGSLAELKIMSLIEFESFAVTGHSTERYVYQCLMHKQCVVCGKRKADLHHVERVGMGRNRDEIFQIGMEVISLCRECHMKAHSKGDSWLSEDIHLSPIPLTVEIGKVYKLTKKNLYREAADVSERQHPDTTRCQSA